jgi:hypothetical protein
MSVRATYRFARVPEWVLYHPDLNGTAVRVFGVLDRFDGRDCFPGRKAVAERLGCSEETVKLALRALRSAGAIAVQARWVRGDGVSERGERQTTNRYHLAGDAPFTEERMAELELPEIFDPPGSDMTPSGGSDSTRTGGSEITRELEQEDPEQEDPETRAVEVSPSAKIAVDLCHLMAERMEDWGAKRPSVGQRWFRDMERMIRLDGRDPEQVQKVIVWLFSSPDEVAQFWAPNIQSPDKLRAKWDVIAAQVRRKHNGHKMLSKGAEALQEILNERAGQ